MIQLFCLLVPRLNTVAEQQKKNLDRVTVTVQLTIKYVKIAPIMCLCFFKEGMDLLFFPIRYHHHGNGDRTTFFNMVVRFSKLTVV